MIPPYLIAVKIPIPISHADKRPIVSNTAGTNIA